MNTHRPLVRSIVFALLPLAPLCHAATTYSYSFWAYDHFPGNSPYYSHYQLLSSTESLVSSIDLYDRGWGYSTTGNSAYHVMDSIDNVFTNSGLLRTGGWHQYQLEFNELTKSASLLVDGNTIRSGNYTDTPAMFQFAFHDYFGGTQETVIDDFELRLDGILVYAQDFDSPTLDSNWSISRLDGGTYIASGDPTTTHSGSGALAVGATSGGNLAASITFVPEPSSLLLCGVAASGMVCRRRRHP